MASSYAEKGKALVSYMHVQKNLNSVLNSHRVGIQHLNELYLCSAFVVTFDPSVSFTLQVRIHTFMHSCTGSINQSQLFT